MGWVTIYIYITSITVLLVIPTLCVLVVFVLPAQVVKGSCDIDVEHKNTAVCSPVKCRS